MATDIIARGMASSTTFGSNLALYGMGVHGAIRVPFPSFYSASDFFLPSDFSATLLDGGPYGADYAVANYTAEQIFDLYSTARTAPELTFYVDPTNGNDSTGDGLTEGTAWKTIPKATTTAIAQSKTVKIKLRGSGSSDAGDGIKNQNFTGGSLAAGNDITVDCVIEFYNGASVMSVHNQYAAPSLHSSATYTYAISITAATDNVLDLTDVDEYGVPRSMQCVPYVASGDISPGCWATNGTLTLIRRKDNVAVTRDFCRILDVAPNVRTTNHVSLGFFPATSEDTLRIHGGGNANGAFDYNIGSSVTDLTTRAICARNVTCVNYSFNSSGAGRGWSIDGLHGICYLENCASLNARTDLFNFHDTRGGTVPGVKTRVVTINCVGRFAGIDVRPIGGSNFISCNGHTLHEDVRAIDLGGDYRFASGGCVRNIGTSQSFYAGTASHDRGDRWLGSTTQPTGYRAQDAAEIYLFRAKLPVSGASSSIAYHNAGGGIFLRDCWSNRGHNIGTIGTW